MIFVATFHKWFVDSKGWHIEEIEAPDEKTAYAKALVIKDELEHNTCEVNFCIVPFVEDRYPNLSRKLTWGERLRGTVRYFEI